MPIIHKKIWPEYFEEVVSGNKTFEYRLADWEAKKGDTLVLEEYDPKTKQYTGRKVEKQIGYVLKLKDVPNFHTQEEIDKYGSMIVSLLNENNLKTIQEKVVRVVKRYGKDFSIKVDKEFAVHKLYEETGEFAEAWLTYTGRSRPEKLTKQDPKTRLAEELADIIGIALLNAELLDIDIEQAMKDKWFKYLE